MDENWTPERPKEEGRFWFYGWASCRFRNLEPYLSIATFRSYYDGSLKCHIDGYRRYSGESLGLWKRINIPDVSRLTLPLRNQEEIKAKGK